MIHNKSRTDVNPGPINRYFATRYPLQFPAAAAAPPSPPPPLLLLTPRCLILLPFLLFSTLSFLLFRLSFFLLFPSSSNHIASISSSPPPSSNYSSSSFFNSPFSPSSSQRAHQHPLPPTNNRPLPRVTQSLLLRLRVSIYALCRLLL